MTTLINTGRPCVNGHVAKRYVFAKNSRCVECARADNKKARANHGARIAACNKKWHAENRDRMTAWSRGWRARNVERTMLAAARKTAKARSLPFDIDVTDIQVPAACPALGIELRRDGGKRTHHSPSLDRVVPAKGYVKGNVIVVSWRANKLKSDATVDELRRLVAFYEKL